MLNSTKGSNDQNKNGQYQWAHYDWGTKEPCQKRQLTPTIKERPKDTPSKINRERCKLQK